MLVFHGAELVELTDRRRIRLGRRHGVQVMATQWQAGHSYIPAVTTADDVELTRLWLLQGTMGLRYNE